MRFLFTSCSIFVSTILFAQGHFWGVTEEGGSSGIGVVYKTNADGTGYSVVKDFEVQYPGAVPFYTQLVEADNGKLYGVTSMGGASDMGVLFEFDPLTSIYTKKIDFDGDQKGWRPFGSLTKAGDGKLYGLTSWGGTDGFGVLFSFDPVTGNFEKKLDLKYSDGIVPCGSLVIAPNGKFYAVTKAGGSGNVGTLVEYDLSSNTISKMVDFQNFPGMASPEGFLTLASNGKLYTFSLSGRIYEFNPANGDFLFKKDMTGGHRPFGSMVEAKNGKLYGTTSTGGAFEDPLNGNGYGTLYEYDPEANTFAIKVNFGFYETGAAPYGGLTVGENGKLYGTTTSGGFGGVNQDQAGVIFEYEIDGQCSILSAFQLETGIAPYGGVTIHSNGKFYGLTTLGGVTGRGVLYEFDPITRNYSKKIDLAFAPDGAYPSNKLTLAADGNIYGVTRLGGTFDNGVIFQLDTLTGSFKKCHIFSFWDDGIATPDGGLTEFVDKKLYGVAGASTPNTLGAVFGFDPESGGLDHVKFSASAEQGNGPTGGLLLASNGKFYGTTRSGQASNDSGTIFEFDPISKTLNKKAEFARTNLGAFPTGNLIEVDGKIYGTTQEGGVNNRGVIFEYSLQSNELIKKFDFETYAPLAASNVYIGPPGSLVYLNGNLYGMTNLGGVNKDGSIYKYSLATNTMVRNFELSPATGRHPYFNGLTLSPINGKIYGAISEGGNYGHGTIFEFDPTSFSFTKLYDFDKATGKSPTGVLTYVPPPLILGTETILNETAQAVYPNPSNSVLLMPQLKKGTVIVKSRIIDFSGRSWTVDAIENDEAFMFSVSNLPCGLYILQVVTTTGRYQAKFAKN